jgi:hypothetical protein
MNSERLLKIRGIVKIRGSKWRYLHESQLPRGVSRRALSVVVTRVTIQSKDHFRLLNHFKSLGLLHFLPRAINMLMSAQLSVKSDGTLARSPA